MVRRVSITPGHRGRTTGLATALGGNDNIESVEAVAITRLRVALGDEGRIDEQALERAGAGGVMRVSDRVVHVIVGEDAAGLAAAMATGAAPAAVR